MKLKPHFSILHIQIIFLFASLLIFPQTGFAENNLGSLKLRFPSDININLFAENVSRARHMAFDDQGILFLSQAKEGKVVALPDSDKNGKADNVIKILENRQPNFEEAFLLKLLLRNFEI